MIRHIVIRVLFVAIESYMWHSMQQAVENPQEWRMRRLVLLGRIRRFIPKLKRKYQRVDTGNLQAEFNELYKEHRAND